MAFIKTRQKLQIPGYISLVIAVLIVGIAVKLFSHAFGAPLGFEAEGGTVTSPAAIVSNAAASAQGAVKFGNICSGTAPPSQYRHVVWIWNENKDDAAVDQSSNAPFLNQLAAHCGKATNIIDNATTVALPSEPQYAAATSGSNCNSGIDTSTGSGTGCVRTDGDHSVASLSTQSIFQLATDSGMSWKSYLEAMPTNCSLVSTGRYAYKHNPAAFYDPIASDCAANDLGFPAINCSISAGGGCTSRPSNALTSDITAGKLANFTFIAADLDNDMHDGTIAQGDNWLNVYVPLITAGPNYRSGDTAIFIMWDEGSTNSGTASNIPTLVIAPSVKPATANATASNNIGLLRTTEDILGLTPYLGCAGATPPGSGNNCSPGSNTSLAAAFNLH